MPFYHKLGQIPHKRHTQFRKPDGGLYREELMGLEGFSSLQSTLYHNFIPPRVKKVEDPKLSTSVRFATAPSGLPTRRWERIPSRRASRCSPTAT
jgi:hypothetical protein